MGINFFLILEIVLDLRRCKGAERKLSQKYFRKILLTVVIFPFLLIRFKNHLTTYLQCSSPQRYPSNRKKAYHRFLLGCCSARWTEKTKQNKKQRNEQKQKREKQEITLYSSPRSVNLCFCIPKLMEVMPQGKTYSLKYLKVSSCFLLI